MLYWCHFSATFTQLSIHLACNELICKRDAFTFESKCSNQIFILFINESLMFKQYKHSHSIWEIMWKTREIPHSNIHNIHNIHDIHTFKNVRDPPCWKTFSRSDNWFKNGLWKRQEGQRSLRNSRALTIYSNCTRFKSSLSLLLFLLNSFNSICFFFFFSSVQYGRFVFA